MDLLSRMWDEVIRRVLATIQQARTTAEAARRVFAEKDVERRLAPAAEEVAKIISQGLNSLENEWKRKPPVQDEATAKSYRRDLEGFGVKLATLLWATQDAEQFIQLDQGDPRPAAKAEALSAVHAFNTSGDAAVETKLAFELYITLTLNAVLVANAAINPAAGVDAYWKQPEVSVRARYATFSEAEVKLEQFKAGLAGFGDGRTAVSALVEPSFRLIDFLVSRAALDTVKFTANIRGPAKDIRAKTAPPADGWEPPRRRPAEIEASADFRWFAEAAPLKDQGANPAPGDLRRIQNRWIDDMRNWRDAIGATVSTASMKPPAVPSRREPTPSLGSRTQPDRQERASSVTSSWSVAFEKDERRDKDRRTSSRARSPDPESDRPKRYKTEETPRDDTTAASSASYTTASSYTSATMTTKEAQTKQVIKPTEDGGSVVLCHRREPGEPYRDLLALYRKRADESTAEVVSLRVAPDATRPPGRELVTMILTGTDALMQICSTTMSTMIAAQTTQARTLQDESLNDPSKALELLLLNLQFVILETRCRDEVRSRADKPSDRRPSDRLYHGMVNPVFNFNTTRALLGDAERWTRILAAAISAEKNIRVWSLHLADRLVRTEWRRPAGYITTKDELNRALHATVRQAAPQPQVEPLAVLNFVATLIAAFQMADRTDTELDVFTTHYTTMFCKCTSSAACALMHVNAHKCMF